MAVVRSALKNVSYCNTHSTWPLPHSDPKIEELINYLDPRFMADYLEDTEYETVTDRLIDEGQPYETRDWTKTHK